MAKRKQKRAATAKEYAVTTFEAVPGMNPEAFGEKWDHSRGFCARATAVLLAMDDKEMAERFLASAKTAHAMMDMHDLLMQEIDYLRLHIEMINTACVRMLAVGHRADKKIMGSRIRA